MSMAEVILVDEQDIPVGVAEKMEAHISGTLHRAFSVFIFNSKGEMLLQQRAISKYHSGGLWTNACCSHPSPGEETASAAQRRLQEELGFVVPVTKVFDFLYKAAFDNGLIEHEFDHVLIGTYDGGINFAPEEVMATAYKTMDDIKQELLLHPDTYTAWFHLAFPKIENWLNEQLQDKEV
jgi:isopentenyl-diphosphate Delta-isomerase